GTALPRLVKRVHRPQELGDTRYESEALALEEGGRAVPAIESGQLRLVVEQLELARRTRHVQINDPPDSGRELRRQGSQWRLRVPRGIPMRASGCAFSATGRARGTCRRDAQKNRPQARTQEVAAGLRLQPRRDPLVVQVTRMANIRKRHAGHLVRAAS